MKFFDNARYPFTHKVLDGTDTHCHILSYLPSKEIAKTRIINKAFVSERTAQLLKNKISQEHGKLLDI